MLRTLPVLATLAMATALQAQVVTEIAAPTVPMSAIDADLLAPGPTTVAAINAVAAPAGGSIAAFNMNPYTTSTAAPGIWSTNANCNGIGFIGGVPEVLSIPGGFTAFDANNVEIVLVGPSTEIGFAVGDWIGPVIIDFYLGGVMQTTITSTTYANLGCPTNKYFQMTGGSFDSCEVRASTTGGNWAFGDFEIQILAGLFPSFTASPSTGASPLNVQFTDSSFSSDPAGVLGWAWDFENDGTIDSTLQNPMHTFTTCGDFDVSLTVIDAAHPPATQVFPAAIQTDLLDASFTWAWLATGVYSFTDTTTPVPTSVDWDFDSDGTIDATTAGGGTAAWPVPSGNNLPYPTTVTQDATLNCRTAQNVEAVVLAAGLVEFKQGGNGTSSSTNVGAYFDISVTNSAGINVGAIETGTYSLVGQYDWDLYITNDTFVGKDGNPAEWRLVATSGNAGAVNATGTGSVASPEFVLTTLTTPLHLPAGNYGCAIFHRLLGGGTVQISYTTGTVANPAPPVVGNGLTLHSSGVAGCSATVLLGGCVFQPRLWNGAFHYESCTQSGVAGFGYHGNGCAGTAGVPELSAANPPQIGTAFTVDVSNVPTIGGAPGVALMIIGLSTTFSANFGALPLDGTPFGAPGCFMRVSDDATSLLPVVGTTGTWTLGIPNDPGLACVVFKTQALVFSQGSNMANWVISDSGSLTIGQ